MLILNHVAAVIFFLNIGLAVLLVFFERRNPTTTWLWLMVLFFLPILGFILYLFIGQDLRKQKLFARKEHLDKLRLHGCSVPEPPEALSPGIVNNLDTIHFHKLSHGSNLSTDNAVTTYAEGEEKYRALITAIEGAQRFIHLEYYIIRNDNLGRKIIELLAQKANSGVEVRLLYDGMGGIRLPRAFFNKLKQAGGKVACFFPPFLPYLNLRLNYRNHRKICVIDGTLAFVGGFNIGDEYLGLNRRFGNWRDTHLSIRGSAVNCLHWRFLLDWRFASGEDSPIDPAWFPCQVPAGSTGIQIVSSGPDNKWSPVRDGYFKIINNAQDHIRIQTPYFIPDESIMTSLRVAALSGVDVRIMIPNKPDHPFVYWATLAHVGKLLKAGVRCFTYQKGFIHSKVVTADGNVASVGTANMDIRSFKLNFEVNAFVYDEAVCQQLEAQFDQDQLDSEELTLGKYLSLPRRIRFKESISRLLSPLL